MNIKISNRKNREASQMCKFIFCLRLRPEMNEPRRCEGHEGKKQEREFFDTYSVFLQNWDAPVTSALYVVDLMYRIS